MLARVLRTGLSEDRVPSITEGKQKHKRIHNATKGGARGHACGAFGERRRYHDGRDHSPRKARLVERIRRTVLTVGGGSFTRRSKSVRCRLADWSYVDGSRHDSVSVRNGEACEDIGIRPVKRPQHPRSFDFLLVYYLIELALLPSTGKC